MSKDKEEISNAYIINLVRACLGKDPIPNTESDPEPAPGPFLWGESLANSARHAFGTDGQQIILDSNTQLTNV